ncbi:MAG: hypothetical protein ACOZQL_00150 [Myxococcota bacterium]
MVLLSLLVVAASSPTFALPGLNAVNISPSEVALHSEVLAQALMRRGLKVTTSRDIQTLLGVERQRQLAGCSEQSCVAELADALGAKGLVVGDVGKVDDGWSVTVRIIESDTGKTLAAFSGQAKANVAGVLERAAAQLAVQAGQALHFDVTPEPKGGVSRWWALAPAAVAVGGGVMGAVFTTQEQSSLATLRAAQYREDALVARDDGARQQTLAWVGFGVAAAGVVGAVTLLLVGDDAPTPVVMWDPHGASFGVAGVLP